MKCRHCSNKLEDVFVDLGDAPPSNSYRNKHDLDRAEKRYPLKVFVCGSCFLVQTQDFVGVNELFSPDYAYFSSTSSAWLKHSRAYYDMAEKRGLFGASSFVVEVASNDGYLLQNFVKDNIDCIGIEPTKSTADAARLKGIDVIEKFFTNSLAQKLSQHKMANLIIGNNVFAHVPDINDFTLGLKTLLHPDGTITLEFPHLLQLLRHNQFDTIYHEHFSYLSLTAASSVFERQGLRIYDVDILKTHGGSIRIYGCHQDAKHMTSKNVLDILTQEQDFGLRNIGTYTSFQPKIVMIRDMFLSFLNKAKDRKERVIGYGAAAKANTLCNYAGITEDLIDCVCDAAKSKQNKFLPGSNIPIYSPDEIKKRKPRWVIIFPWNIKEEIMEQLSFIQAWGGEFVIVVPSLRVIAP